MIAADCDGRCDHGSDLQLSTAGISTLQGSDLVTLVVASHVKWEHDGQQIDAACLGLDQPGATPICVGFKFRPNAYIPEVE